jgi:cytochrome c nitrite reductase small subunit
MRRGCWRSARLPIVAAIVLGVLGGIGAFTFGYGEGAAYLTNNPAACANCHVMQDHLRLLAEVQPPDVATCNDCHLPHDLVGKWITKADNGFFHSLAFTTGDFHEPIRIKPRNRRVTQHACLHCHADFVNHMLPEEPGGDMLNCVHCHSAGRPRPSITLQPPFSQADESR